MKKFASRGVPTPRKDRPSVLPLKGEIDLHVYAEGRSLRRQILAGWLAGNGALDFRNVAA